MWEEKIAFANPAEAHALLGEHDIYLKALTEGFDCRFVSRGDALIIDGEEAEVRAAASVVLELQYLHRQGTTITMHEVRYSITLVKEGRGERLHNLFAEALLITSRGRRVRAKTIGQRMYLDTIRKHDVSFGIGPAGTGKTYLAVVMAVVALRNREVEKIILTRPAVEAGERLGFLPGDLQDKVDPYLRPLYDALHDIMGYDTYQKLFAKGVIEIAPLAYMRGRTLEDAFVILDEAQNTTSSQMKMFLTRLGFGSKMVVTGDLSQVDLPAGVSSGLREASHLLRHVEGVGVSYLHAQDVIRHDVVARIVEAYDQAAAEKRRDRESLESVDVDGDSRNVCD